MLGYPLRSFSLCAEGVSLCTVCVTGAVTPHPLDGGSLGTHGGGQLGPMSLKWWRSPRWFPHISEGSVAFKGLMRYLGIGQSVRASIIRYLAHLPLFPFGGFSLAPARPPNGSKCHSPSRTSLHALAIFHLAGGH